MAKIPEHNHDLRYYRRPEIDRRSAPQYLMTQIKSVDGPGSGLDADTLDGLHASGLAAAVHTHDDRYFTESESDLRFAALVHTHDDRYFTETESDTRFGRLASVNTWTTHNYFGGNVGIGTTSPVSTLDVIGSGLRMASTATDTTDKYSYVRSRHYTNSEEDFLAFFGGSSSTQNFAWFGGGSGAYNAATYLAFFTAANNTTLTGTERVRIDSSGNVGIRTTSPQGILHAHDGTGGFMVVSKSGIGATAVVLVPNGTGDCVRGVSANGVGLTSGGTAAGITFVYCANGSSATLMSTGGETLTLRVNADGSIDVRRTAGSGTFTIILYLLWM